MKNYTEKKEKNIFGKNKANQNKAGNLTKNIL